jgi:hypothetical protein
MSIGDITGWIQLGVWIMGGLVWFYRHRQQGQKQWIAWILKNDWVLFAIIALGLIISAIPVIDQISNWAGLDAATITAASRFVVGADTKLAVISNETFQDQDVPLDGYMYDHCTFINVCMVYRGGNYRLESVNLRKHWKVCVVDQTLQNLHDFYHQLNFFKDRIKDSKKVFINPSNKKSVATLGLPMCDS